MYTKPSKTFAFSHPKSLFRYPDIRPATLWWGNSQTKPARCFQGELGVVLRETHLSQERTSRGSDRSSLRYNAIIFQGKSLGAARVAWLFGIPRCHLPNDLMTTGPNFCFEISLFSVVQVQIWRQESGSSRGVPDPSASLDAIHPADRSSPHVSGMFYNMLSSF